MVLPKMQLSAYTPTGGSDNSGSGTGGSENTDIEDGGEMGE